MLTVTDVCVDVMDKRILWDVSAGVNRGEILAIMGPSGSGKTTLLNAIAGYIPMSKGTIFVDRVDLSVDGTARKTMSYVMQNELFFEDLTLRETLVYSTLLRLSYKVSFKQKFQKVDEIIESLGLVDCQHTIVGGSQHRGLSGGEKKRLSLACELALQANTFLLDEPTSGLDSSAAFSLFTTLKKLAHEEGKTVITSIHQPSSQLFYSFDRLLLIAKGKVAYSGPAATVMDYFGTVGLHCSVQCNPADFAMDMLTDATSREVLIGLDPPSSNSEGQCTHLLCQLWPFRRGSLCRLLCRRSKQSSTSQQQKEQGDNEEAFFLKKHDALDNEREEDHKATVISQESSLHNSHKGRDREKAPPIPSTNQSMTTEPKTTADPIKADSPPSPEGEEQQVESGKVEDNGKYWKKKPPKHKWNRKKDTVVESLWVCQFIVLMHRTLKRSRKRLLSKLVLFQVFCFLLITSVVWFQVPYVEESIRDRTSLLFYIQGSWAFQIIGLTVGSFPFDRHVVAKEKAAKYYKLSAYFVVKLMVEMSFISLLTSLLYVPLFFIAGLRGVGAFFGTYLTVIVHSLTVQSIALLFGAIFMDTGRAVTFAFTAYIPSFVLGGFLVSKVPEGMEWMAYLTPLRYAYNAALYFNFIGPDISFECAPVSNYPSCLAGGSNSTRIPGTEVLQILGVNDSIYMDIGVLFLFLAVITMGVYLALRLLRGLKPPQ